MSHENCPVSVSGDAELTHPGRPETDWKINCPVCGVFALEHPALIRLTHEISTRSDKRSAVLSYYVRRMQREGTPAKLTLQLLDEFLTRKLPDASEQADNFILWLGDRTVPGETTKSTAAWTTRFLRQTSKLVLAGSCAK
jgi:hypothetical protein